MGNASERRKQAMATAAVMAGAFVLQSQLFGYAKRC